MTPTQEAAMRQALEALGLAKLNGKSGLHPAEIEEIAGAITALSAALEEPTTEYSSAVEPVQEPVAWMHTDPDNTFVCFLEWRENEPGYRGRWIKTPLYTAPPQRKPLTEEEIDALALVNSYLAFARAVEQAHGII